MQIPTRADIPETDKWDLTQLFANVSKWQEDFASLQCEYPKLEEWKGRVGESAQTLAGLLEFEKHSSKRWSASITTRRCKLPRTARIMTTSRGSARFKI